MRRDRRLLIRAVVLVALSITQPAFAAGEGEPSLFGGGFMTALLAVIVFVLLLAVLGRFAWKPLLEALKKREETIRNDIDSAREEREQAEKLLREYQQRLDSTQAEAERMLKSAAVEAEKLRNRILEDAQAHSKETIEKARAKIDAATADAIKEIYSRSATLATELAAKILQREVNPEDHRILITQALAQLEAQKGDKLKHGW